MKSRELFVGASRGLSQNKALQVFHSKISKLVQLKGDSLLDIGCGEGSFTEKFSDGFSNVYAIDVQDKYIDIFKKRKINEKKYIIQKMSAENMKFTADFFDTIITFETIEHIQNLESAVKEMYRVLKPGGTLILTCPNRLFPFENHGVVFRGKEIHGRIPLITYFPYLHEKYSLARVFSQKSLNTIFVKAGFSLIMFDYLFPTFEHGGNKLQPVLKFLFPLMRKLEYSPLKIFGTSIVGIFRK
jgi:ubiquinone/menaquinone biosynthesis C-methylase UbiE